MHRPLVVLDDDPTGCQSRAGCPLLVEVDAPAAVARAAAAHPPAIFLLTDARALETPAATAAVDAALDACAAGLPTGVEPIYYSRGDSTLRGHAPLEIERICRRLPAPPDAIVFCPALPAAGRVTIDGRHWLRDDAGLTPLAATPYARDRRFGYRHDRLAAWLAERSGGRIAAAGVHHLALAPLRAGTAAATIAACDGAWIVVDAETEGDLERLATACRELIAQGRRLLFQGGPALLRALAGLPPPRPWRPTGIADPGLVLVGSHVPLSDRQLERLLQRPDAVPVELDIDLALRDPTTALADLMTAATAAADAGHTPVCFTSRGERRLSADQGLKLARLQARLLRELPWSPGFVVVKGGITSHLVLAEGMAGATATVAGPLLPGLPVVELPHPHDGSPTPVIIVPGNVGSDGTLARCMELLAPCAVVDRS